MPESIVPVSLEDRLIAAMLDSKVSDVDLWWMAYCWSVQSRSPLMLMASAGR